MCIGVIRMNVERKRKKKEGWWWIDKLKRKGEKWIVKTCIVSAFTEHFSYEVELAILNNGSDNGNNKNNAHNNSLE